MALPTIYTRSKIVADPEAEYAPNRTRKSQAAFPKTEHKETTD